VGRRLGSKDLHALGGCGKGLALGVRLLDRLGDLDIGELDAIADTVVGPSMARYAREQLGLRGETPYTAHQADFLSERTGDPLPHPEPLDPDNLRPDEATYGDQALDGSGASYARLK
jgi:hypothetical protein